MAKEKLTKEEKKKLKAELLATKQKIKAERKENRKKGRKVFFTIFILLILAGIGCAIFFIGWINPKLSNDEFAIFFSKTGGYYDKIISSTDFVWRWEKLIPTNGTVLVYKSERKIDNIDVQGVLPSGELYSTLLNGEYNFSFKMKLKTFYRINKDDLINLAKAGITPDKTDTYIKEFEENFKDITVDFIQEQSTNRDFVDLMSKDLNGIGKLIIDYSKTKYPYILIEKISIDKLNIPDISLYYKAREKYLTVLETFDISKIESIAKEKNIENYTKLNNLEDLAKLLTKYPALLEYFKATGNSKTILPNLPADKE